MSNIGIVKHGAFSSALESYARKEAYVSNEDLQKKIGSAKGQIPVNGAALGTTDNNIVVTNTSGQLKPSGKTPDILYKMANAGAVCSTAIGTPAKTIAITGFTLFPGVTVKVMFTEGNSAASPTLNVNSTGAKAIKVVRAGAKIVPTNKTGYWRGASSTSSEMWQPYTTLELLYDGTDWVIMGNPVTESGTSGAIAGSKVTYAYYTVYADGKTEVEIYAKQGALELSKDAEYTFKYPVIFKNFAAPVAILISPGGYARCSLTDTSINGVTVRTTDRASTGISILVSGY